MILHRFGRPFETYTADFKHRVTCFEFCSNLEEKRNSSVVMQIAFLNEDYPNKKFPTKLRIDKFDWTPIDGEFAKQKTKNCTHNKKRLR